MEHWIARMPIMAAKTDDLPLWKKIPLITAQFILKVTGKFFQDNCLTRASSLGFSTLMALVPLLAVFISFGGYSAFENIIQRFLVETLIPTSQTQYLDALNNFAANSQKLGTVGLLIFLVTVLMLMNTIENHFNMIFRCRREESLFHRFTAYTAALVFGSLLIGGSFGISRDFLRMLTMADKFSFKLIHGFSFSSTGFMFSGLLALIFLVPAGKVKLKAAVPGALFGAFAWETAKYFFGVWAQNSVNMSVIYGSLVMIPLLLLWLYISWVVILISLQISFMLQNSHYRLSGLTDSKGLARRFVLGLELFFLVSERFEKRKDPLNVRQCSHILNCTEGETAILAELMVEKNLFVLSEGRKEVLLPAAPISEVVLGELVRLFGGVPDPVPVISARDRVAIVLEVMQKYSLNDMDKIPLENLFADEDESNE